MIINKKVYIGLCIAMLLMCGTAIAEWNVTWTPIKESIIDKEYIITVQNLQPIKRDVNIASFFTETTFDISQLSDIKFFEWKLIPYNYTLNYYDEISYLEYDSLNDTWYTKEEKIYNYTETIESKKLDWKSCKSQLFTETSKTKENNYGFINIPKLGSEDDNDGTFNGTKIFMLKFKTPIVYTDLYGSSGKVAILLDGEEYHPWWDTSWSIRKKLILTGNISGVQTNYQLLLNISYETDMQIDFDDLRFCNETHELGAWLESKVDSSYAHVWVEFPTTPANEINQTYYMYYGNEGVASDWDIEATFVFGDDFNRANSGTVGNGWSEDHDASWAIDTNRLKYAYAASSNTLLHKECTCGDYVYTWRAMASQTDASFYPRVEFDAANKRGGIAFHSNGILYYLDSGGWHSIGAYSASTWYECRLTYHVATGLFDYEVVGLNSGDGKSPHVSGSGNCVVMQTGEQTGTAYVDHIYVRKYTDSPPTYIFCNDSYIPPDPVNLANIAGNFWINHTWDNGIGNVVDSYNVSVNDVWYNTTIDTFYNDTYFAHAWQNITVHAFNSTGTGTLSSGNISEDTQIPNNPITITNTSDWTGNASENVYVDYDAIDMDSDTATFSCNRTDLFTDFDTLTGKGNWTATANIYYVDFGVSDGHGSIDNFTMTLIELSVTPLTLIEETNLITSEIINELSNINMGDYLVYAFILIGILLIILVIEIINNGIYMR